MLTNNGKALLYCCDYNTGTYQSSYSPDGTALSDPDWYPSYTLQRTNGIAETLYRYTEDIQPKKLSFNYLASGLEVVIGNGDTPATVNDYQLNNEIISPNLKELFKASQNKTNCNREYNAPLIMHAQKQYYNASLIDSIAIKEIGLITKDGYGYSYLLLREVLNEPIILGPDETITLTIIVN